MEYQKDREWLELLSRSLGYAMNNIEEGKIVKAYKEIEACQKSVRDKWFELAK